MSKRNYYDILGVSRDASQIDIKKAFRKKAMQYHPDRNKAAGAEEKFKEINAANEVLSNPSKRKQYDQFGSSAFNGSSGQQGFGNFEGFGNFGGFGDINDIFSSFFGGGRSNTPRQGRDYQMQISITFLESIFGKVFTQKLDKWEGNSQIKKEAEINIPAGVKNGMSVLVRGFGGQGYNGGPNGDLYIRVDVQKHKYYIRQDDDIHIHMPVSMFDIISEKKLAVPTPYGNVGIRLKTSMTSDEIIVVSGKGFRALRKKHIGDFKIHITTYIPKLSSKDKKLIEKIASSLKTSKAHEKWVKSFK